MWVLDRIKSSRVAKMVEECDREFKLSSNVKKAMLKINREEFVPHGFRANAYKLDALPLSSAQWISSPLTVAKMSEYILPLDSSLRVLEIGCGSGYQAAVLSQLFRGVFTIERIGSLLLEAKSKFSALGLDNIIAKIDDGQSGWKQYAPFDRILFSATAKEIPQVIFDQLSEDEGILVAPLEVGSKQIITRFIKYGSTIKAEELEECEFVPILSGIQK
ncbi:MAG: protein-L-isoaspartate(D-aspartate) O-methyltransferase [Sulfurimonas sp.]